MSTDGIPGNPFEVLGVPLDADGRAVRRAFADKLREARGSGDADAVRRVQDAFEAIRDDLPREQLRRYSENEARLGPLLLEADAAIAEGKMKKARRLLGDCLATLPDFVPALWKIAHVVEAMDDVDAGVETFDKLSRLLPQNPEARFGLARACAEKAGRAPPGDPSKEPLLEKALESVGRARELGKDEATCLMFACPILRLVGRKAEAREELRRLADSLVEIDARHVPVLGLLLQCEAEDGTTAGFEEILEGILSRTPKEPRKRLSFLAAVEGASRDLLALSPPLAVRCAELALQSLSGAEDGGPEAALLRSRLQQIVEVESRVAPLVAEAAAAMSAKDFVQARALLGRILEIDESSLQALQVLSDVEEALGNEDRAIEHLERIVELVPDDAGASFRLALALAKRGSPDSRRTPARKRELLKKALAALDRARGLGATEAQCVHLGSAIRSWLGRDAEDREILAEFVQRMPELDAIGLAVVKRLLEAQALAGLEPGFQATLERVKTLLPEEPEERQEIGVALLEVAQGLSPAAPGLALRCGEIAAACQPEDARAARLLADLRASRRAPLDAPAPEDPEPKGLGLLPIAIALMVASALARGCVATLSPRGDSTRKSDPPAQRVYTAPDSGLRKAYPARPPTAKDFRVPEAVGGRPRPQPRSPGAVPDLKPPGSR